MYKIINSIASVHSIGLVPYAGGFNGCFWIPSNISGGVNHDAVSRPTSAIVPRMPVEVFDLDLVLGGSRNTACVETSVAYRDVFTIFPLCMFARRLWYLNSYAQPWNFWL